MMNPQILIFLTVRKALQLTPPAFLSLSSNGVSTYNINLYKLYTYISLLL